MNGKILVTYATAAGSTAQVAEKIGEIMREDGTAVDVRRAQDITDLSAYHAVVLGTGVRAGRVYREAVTFAEQHQDALNQVSVAYFLVCLTMKEDTPENRAEAMTFLAPLREKAPQVQPVDVGLFGGVVDYDTLSLPFKLILKLRKEPAGDHRDWEKIRAWALDTREALVDAKGAQG